MNFLLVKKIHDTVYKMFILFCILVIPYMLFVLYVNDLLYFLLSFWQTFLSVECVCIYIYTCVYVCTNERMNEWVNACIQVLCILHHEARKDWSGTFVVEVCDVKLGYSRAHVFRWHMHVYVPAFLAGSCSNWLAGWLVWWDSDIKCWPVCSLIKKRVRIERVDIGLWHFRSRCT
jgi:hypothetical protein